MKRDALLEALGLVEPALASNDLIPVLTHYWFKGDEVMAYNDVIAIAAPYKTDFVGAIRGSLLMGTLTKLTGSEVDFIVEGDTVTIKSKRSRMKAPLLSEKDFLFTFPKVKAENATWTIKGKDEVAQVAAAIEICLQALSRRVSEPQRLGVTLVPSKKTLNFYATDSITLSAASISAKIDLGAPHVTLAKPFCESALRLLLRKGVDEASLFVTDEYSLLQIGKGKTAIKLYGRLVDDPNPPKFQAVVSQYLPEDSDELLVPLPKTLEDALDRAFLVVQKSLDPVTAIKVGEDSKGHSIRIHSKSEQGEVLETIKLDEEHENVKLEIDLSRLRECDLSRFDRILFDSRCVVLASGDNMLHLIASIS